MQIRQLQVSVTRLVAGPIGPLAKYENITFSCQVEASLSTTDNPHEAYDELTRFCKDKINSEMDRLEGKVVKTAIEADYIPKGL